MKRFPVLMLAWIAACPQPEPAPAPAPAPETKPPEATKDKNGDDQGHTLVEVKDPKSFREVEARALQLFALGRLDEAIALVGPFGQDASNLGAQRLLAMIHLRRGDGDKAAPFVEGYRAHPGAQKSILASFERRQAQLKAGGKGSFNHGPFTSLLKEAVKGLSVDYTVVKNRSGELEEYLKAIADADAGALQTNERKAFFANAYNAWVLKAVLNNKLTAVDGKKSVKEVEGFFDKQQYPVAGDKMTLNQLEAKLRPPHGAAEVHFLVNCASVSCPPLRASAFTGADWQSALEAQTRAYLKRDVTVDKAKKTIKVVKLFEWYEEDFGGKEGVRKFLQKYGVKEAGDASWKIETKPYDWRLNKVRQ